MRCLFSCNVNLINCLQAAKKLNNNCETGRKSDEMRCLPTSTQVYRNSAFLFFKSHRTMQPDSKPINNYTNTNTHAQTHMNVIRHRDRQSVRQTDGQTVQSLYNYYSFESWSWRWAVVFVSQMSLERGSETRARPESTWPCNCRRWRVVFISHWTTNRVEAVSTRSRWQVDTNDT